MKRTSQLLRLIVLILATLALCACQSSPSRVEAKPVVKLDPQGWFDGEYDNHEQVWQARPVELPRLRFNLAPMAAVGWYAWHIQWNADTKLSATWLLHMQQMTDGSIALTPHRPLVANAETGNNFDPKQWIALDACVLQGSITGGQLVARADSAKCSTVAPGVGVEAALLPLSIEREGEWLRVRLYADQARSADARAEARRVRWYKGWAAVNGAGANATSDSNDWHMNRDLRLDNEGGRAPLNWRDGKPSGYSLELERITYREGNTPVLKLSVIEDSSARAVVYAWANPEATRIGLNLGWIQIGLELDNTTTSNARP